MTGRRTSTTTQPTPLEETEPTAPAQPAPEPAPEPTAEELDARVADRVSVAYGVPPDVSGLPVSPGFRDGYQAAAAEFAADQREEYPLTVHEAIAEVTRRVEHIGKDHRAESGERYAYRGIDDVLLALHPILGDVGLVLMPGRITDHRRETRTTAKGATLNVAMVTVRYRLIGPDGSTTTGEAVGEAHDSGDKATQKALSQAYKSFALQTFSIPTESSAEEEPDRTNEPGRPFTAEEVTRASNAELAARQAGTVEQLASVRQRALHLLNVPLAVDGQDTVAPLSWWIDRRRAELEGVTG